VPITLVAVQAVADIAFVAWVSSLATIASFWLADSGSDYLGVSIGDEDEIHLARGERC